MQKEFVQNLSHKPVKTVLENLINVRGFYKFLPEDQEISGNVVKLSFEPYTVIRESYRRKFIVLDSFAGCRSLFLLPLQVHGI